jgi:hypothetical protein
MFRPLMRSLINVCVRLLTKHQAVNGFLGMHSTAKFYMGLKRFVITALMEVK